MRHSRNSNRTSERELLILDSTERWSSTTFAAMKMVSRSLALHHPRHTIATSQLSLPTWPSKHSGTAVTYLQCGDSASEISHSPAQSKYALTCFRVVELASVS